MSDVPIKNLFDNGFQPENNLIFKLPPKLTEFWWKDQKESLTKKLQDLFGLNSTLSFTKLEEIKNNFLLKKSHPKTFKPAQVIPLFFSLQKLFINHQDELTSKLILKNIQKLLKFLPNYVKKASKPAELEIFPVLIYALLKQRNQLELLGFSNSELDLLLQRTIEKCIYVLGLLINEEESNYYKNISVTKFLRERLDGISTTEEVLSPFVLEIKQKQRTWFNLQQTKREEISSRNNDISNQLARTFYQANQLIKEEINKSRIKKFRDELTEIIDLKSKSWNKPIQYTLDKIKPDTKLILIDDTKEEKESLGFDDYTDGPTGAFLKLIQKLSEKGFKQLLFCNFFNNIVFKSDLLSKLQILDESITYGQLKIKLRNFFNPEQKNVTDFNIFLFESTKHNKAIRRDQYLSRFFRFINHLKQIQLNSGLNLQFLEDLIPTISQDDKTILVNSGLPDEMIEPNDLQINFRNFDPDDDDDIDNQDHYDIFGSTAYEQRFSEDNSISSRSKIIALDFDQPDLKSFSERYTNETNIDIDKQGYGRGISLINLPGDDLDEDEGINSNPEPIPNPKLHKKLQIKTPAI